MINLLHSLGCLINFKRLVAKTTAKIGPSSTISTSTQIPAKTEWVTIIYHHRVIWTNIWVPTLIPKTSLDLTFEDPVPLKNSKRCNVSLMRTCRLSSRMTALNNMCAGTFGDLGENVFAKVVCLAENEGVTKTKYDAIIYQVVTLGPIPLMPSLFVEKRTTS